jgi:hypothetical protein
MQTKNSIISTGRALLLAVIAYFGMTQGAEAATAVSGAITADTTWTLAQSPYQVTADVSVENAATLTVEAGVVIAFDAARNLIVNNGTLNARGTTALPIIFTSTLDKAGNIPAPGDWGQIRFQNGTNSATILEYAQIRYGQGIKVQAASPTFNYLYLSWNQGAAINIDLESSPRGIGNQAKDNTLNGISVPAGEVLGNVSWGIGGIPYVVASGVLSVGVSPLIASINPVEAQQGLAVDAVISGARLAGADSIVFESSGINASLSGSGSDTSLPVHIVVSAAQPTGTVPFTLRTSAGWVRYASGLSIIPLKPTIAVTSFSPSDLRRTQTQNFQISGSSLSGAQVSVPPGLGLTLSNLQTSASSASFDLTASSSATLGVQTLTLTNPLVANGFAALSLNILDALPRIDTSTIPSAVNPDGVVYVYLLSLTHADTVSNTFNLSTLDPAIVSVSPSTVTIPAGALSAPINITGLQLGLTLLNISSSRLAAISKQIYAASLVTGSTVGPVLSAPVGVSAPFSIANLPSGTVVPVASVPVGVTVPYNTSTLLPNGTVVPLNSATVGVMVPYNTSTLLPNGAVVPLNSATVGVDVPYTLTNLPAGTAIGPVLSVPVGVDAP